MVSTTLNATTFKELNHDDHDSIVDVSFNSTSLEVFAAWEVILEHCFPKKTDKNLEVFIHEIDDTDFGFEITVKNPHSHWPRLPLLYVYCEAVPPKGVHIFEPTQTEVEAKLLQVFEDVPDSKPKPNVYAVIAVGPMVRFYGVTKEGRYWEVFAEDDLERAWNFHDDFHAIVEALLIIRSKIALSLTPTVEDYGGMFGDLSAKELEKEFQEWMDTL